MSTPTNGHLQRISELLERQKLAAHNLVCARYAIAGDARQFLELRRIFEVLARLLRETGIGLTLDNAGAINAWFDATALLAEILR